MPSAIVKITHNLLWFNIEGNIDTLEDRKKIQKEELDLQLQEIEDSISLHFFTICQKET
jgi:hypothetical protein